MIVWLALACAHKAGPATELPKYDNGLLSLAAGFSAKEVCSCVFVAQRPTDVCRDWTRVSPAVARFHVDTERKEVRATALATSRTVARWVDEDLGCVLVPR